MRAWLIVILFFILLPTATLQFKFYEDKKIIFKKDNFFLPKNENYRKNLFLQPYALHEIQYQVQPSNISTLNPLVIISLTSNLGSIIIRIFNNSLSFNESYTPRTSNYRLEIKNEGYTDINMNFTITQIGEPITSFYKPEAIVAEIIIPIILLLYLSILIPISMIAIFRRKHLGKRGCLKPNHVAYLMATLTLILPQHFIITSNNINPLALEISGAFWRYYSYLNPPILVGIFGDQLTLIIRILFCYGIYQYYQRKATKRHILAIGAISLSWGIIPILLRFFFPPWDPFSPYFEFYGPLPILLILGIALVCLIPPPKLSRRWNDFG
jgi:hypothetical protein